MLASDLDSPDHCRMDTVSFIYVILAFLGGLLISQYVPAYARKKGENVATKEDIAAITEKIESVKATIDRQTRLLSTKQELLMNFFDEVTVLYYELLGANFGDFPMDEGKSLFEYQSQFNKSVAEITKAFQRLVIFLPSDSKLLDVCEKITKSVIASRKVLARRFDKIKVTLTEETGAYRSGDLAKIKEAAGKADEANSVFWNDMRPCDDAIKEHYLEFLSEMNSHVANEQIQ